MALHRGTLQDAASATGVGSFINVKGKPGALLDVSGTFTATIKPQGKLRSGWADIAAMDLATGLQWDEIHETGLYWVHAPGLINVRANISAYTSGNVTVEASAPDDGLSSIPGTAWDSYNNSDLDETAVQVKEGAGALGDVHITNEKDAKLYVKAWDALLADVSVGTTTPDWIWPVTTNGDTNGSGFIRDWLPQGRKFTTGLVVACVTGIGDAASTGPGANECIFDATYK
jgi:hypothetical protein